MLPLRKSPYRSGIGIAMANIIKSRLCRPPPRPHRAAPIFQNRFPGALELGHRTAVSLKRQTSLPVSHPATRQSRGSAIRRRHFPL